MDREFYKNTFINSWSVTGKQSNHPLFKNANQGDIAFIFNDPTSTTGRRMQFVSYDSWYFYIKNTRENQDFISKHKYIKYQAGKDWIRIYCRNKEYKDPNVFKLVKFFEDNEIKTYEADISPMKRLCLDYDVKVEDFENIRVLYFDIETEDTGGGIVVGKERILSMAAYDNTGKSYYLANNNERDLLYAIDDLIKQYDMLVGWNSWAFDLPYLKARYKLHKVPGDYLWNILHEDMMKRVYYFYSKEPVARQEITSYSLEYISQYFLKEGKVKTNKKFSQLTADELKIYNLRDAELLMMLEKKLGTIGHTYRLFQMCQVFASNWSMVKSIDNFILMDGNKKGIHFRTNLNHFRDGEEVEVDDDYVGALVLDPVPGYYKDVYDLDFRSLYPNIIRTFNISPETLLLEYHKIDGKVPQILIPKMTIADEVHGGMMFIRNVEGIVPGKIGILLDERNKLKKTLKDMDPDSQEYKTTFAKQWVTKDLANSFYGVLGNRYFREFNTDMSEAITVTGQYLLTWVNDYLNKTGRKSIYGDTDSVFAQIKGKEKIEDVLKEINKELTSHLIKEFNVKNCTIELGFDCKFDTFLIESKKKYAGNVDGKLRMRGMESVKRDTIPISVAAQKQLLNLIFKDTKSLKVKNWLELLKQSIHRGSFKPIDIAFRKRINKDPKTYKSTPLHVKLAQAQGHGSGQIVQYIITDGSGKLEGVSMDDFKGNWDRTYYWNNAIYPMLEKILKIVYPKVDWDIYYITLERKSKRKVDTRQKTIFDAIDETKEKKKKAKA